MRRRVQRAFSFAAGPVTTIGCPAFWAIRHYLLKLQEIFGVEFIDFHFRYPHLFHIASVGIQVARRREAEVGNIGVS